MAVRTLLAVAFLLLSGYSPRVAAQGTTGVEFLKLGIGARAVGMGEAFVSLADDASAAYWNPAGIAPQSGQHVLLTHQEWFEDIRLENASYLWANEKQGVGLSATLLYAGQLEERDDTGQFLGEFRYFDFAMGLSYAREIVPSVSAGMTGKFLREEIDRDTATTLAVDLGVLVQVPGTGFRVGGAVSNLGQGLKFNEVRDKLPRTVSLGVSYEMPGILPGAGGLTLAADVFKPREGDTSLRLGGEFGFAGVATYRLGYVTGHDSQDIGTGFGVDLGKYTLDYAYVPSSFELGDTHRFSLGLGF
jgi:hypothetical protein